MRFRSRVPSTRSLTLPTPEDVADADIALRREALWYVGAPEDTPGERRNHLISTMWSAHVLAGSLAHFERFGIPLLRAMAGLRPGRAVVVRQSGTTFDAGATHRLIQQCLAVDTLVMVELYGDWSTAALQVLGAVRPAFVRLGQEYAAGASVLPEQARRLALLADCMARSSVPLVAQGSLAADDDRAVRVAGIDLRLVAETAGVAPWPSNISLGSAPRPVVLEFPSQSPRT